MSAALVIALSGCASGAIFSGTEPPPPSAARLMAASGVVAAVSPLHQPNRQVSVPRSRPLDMALSAGWYMVTYSCDVLEENGEVVAITMREYSTQRSIHIRPGRRYKLSCAPKQMGVLQVQDLGLATNNSFKPTPLRGAA